MRWPAAVLTILFIAIPLHGLSGPATALHPFVPNGILVDQQWQTKGHVEVSSLPPTEGAFRIRTGTESITVQMTGSTTGYTTTPGATKSWDVARLDWPSDSIAENFIIYRDDASTLAVTYVKDSSNLHILEAAIASGTSGFISATSFDLNAVIPKELPVPDGVPSLLPTLSSDPEPTYPEFSPSSHGPPSGSYFNGRGPGNREGDYHHTVISTDIRHIDYASTFDEMELAGGVKQVNFVMWSPNAGAATPPPFAGGVFRISSSIETMYYSVPQLPAVYWLDSQFHPNGASAFPYDITTHIAIGYGGGVSLSARDHEPVETSIYPYHYTADIRWDGVLQRPYDKDHAVALRAMLASYNDDDPTIPQFLYHTSHAFTEFRCPFPGACSPYVMVTLGSDQWTTTDLYLGHYTDPTIRFDNYGDWDLSYRGSTGGNSVVKPQQDPLILRSYDRFEFRPEAYYWIEGAYTHHYLFYYNATRVEWEDVTFGNNPCDLKVVRGSTYTFHPCEYKVIPVLMTAAERIAERHCVQDYPELSGDHPDRPKHVCMVERGTYMEYFMPAGAPFLPIWRTYLVN